MCVCDITNTHYKHCIRLFDQKSPDYSLKAREFLCVCVSAHIVLEEENPTEEAEEVRGEQGEVD